MISHRAQGSLLIAVSMVCVAVLILISGCGITQSVPAAPAVVNQSATTTSSTATSASTATAGTRVPTNTDVICTPTEDATVSWQEFKAGYPPGWFQDPTVAAAVTQIAIQGSQHLTAIALTPTLGPAPYTPEPTPTLGVGMIKDVGCYRPLHDGGPQYPSCWDTYVNGTWLFVAAGYTGGGIGAYNPPPKSLLLVCPEPLSEHLGSDSKGYFTPVNVGEIRIESISGSLVTVVPRDPANHTSFVFDLATRQWVNPPTPGPSPSASASPLPSVSPLPTQGP